MIDAPHDASVRRVPDAVPADFADLVDAPRVVALTTLMPDGRPQTSVVWCDADATHIRINSMRHFRKTENMRRDPRVALLCYDPRRPLRYLEIHGTVVEMTEDGAQEHLDALASKYMGRPGRYFGDCVAAELATTEVPVLCRIAPTHVVTLDAERDPTDGCPAARPFDRVSAAPTPAPAWSPSPEPTRPAGDPAAQASLVPIPASHLDLVGAPHHGVVTTLMVDGSPRSSLVWLDQKGGCARLNTTLERHKGRDLVASPAVSLLVVDAQDTSRYIQVRGDAELVLDGAIEHLDRLTRAYTRHPCYYGHIYPEAQRARETRVICLIRARRITLDAIHR